MSPAFGRETAEVNANLAKAEWEKAHAHGIDITPDESREGWYVGRCRGADCDFAVFSPQMNLLQEWAAQHQELGGLVDDALGMGAQ